MYMKIEHHFSRFAVVATNKTGRFTTFIAAIIVLLLWVVSGQYFHYSAKWLEAIGTITTLTTFFMVLLLQNSQNRDMRTIQMKLDELIHSHAKAPNELIEIEKLPETEIDLLQKKRREKRRAKKAA
jgi:low affinity Fe/Cu permease